MVKSFVNMIEYDSDKDVFEFPLAVNLHGEEHWLMVQAAAFTGGLFYIVRGKGVTPVHILGIFEDEQENGKLHFTVMNEDTSSEDVVAAVLYALREPDNDDLPNEEVSDGLPLE